MIRKRTQQRSPQSLFCLKQRRQCKPSKFICWILCNICYVTGFEAPLKLVLSWLSFLLTIFGFAYMLPPSEQVGSLISWAWYRQGGLIWHFRIRPTFTLQNNFLEDVVIGEELADRVEQTAFGGYNLFLLISWPIHARAVLLQVTLSKVTWKKF